jgi:hypothetical protein
VSIILLGDRAAAGHWVAFARAKAAALGKVGTNLSQTYKPAPGVTVRVQTLQGTPRIWIEAGGGYEYITVGDAPTTALRGLYAGDFGPDKVAKLIDPYLFNGSGFAFGPTGGRVGKSLLHAVANTFITGPANGSTCEHAAIIKMAGKKASLTLLPQGISPQYGQESILTVFYGGKTLPPNPVDRYEMYCNTDEPNVVSVESSWVTGPIVIPTYTSTVPLGVALTVDDGGLVSEGLENPPPAGPMQAGVYNSELTAGGLISYSGWEWELVELHNTELNASIWKPSAAQCIESAASVEPPYHPYASLYPTGGTAGADFYKRWNWRTALKLDITASTHTNTLGGVTTHAVNFRFDFVERVHYVTNEGLPYYPYGGGSGPGPFAPTFGPEAFEDIRAIGNPPDEYGDPGQPHSGLSGGLTALTFTMTVPGTSSPPFSPADGPFEGAGAVWMAAHGSTLVDPGDATAYPAFIYWAGDEYFEGDKFVQVNYGNVSDNSAVRLSEGRIAILVITRNGGAFKHVRSGAPTAASDAFGAGGSYMNNLVTIISSDNGLSWHAKIRRLSTAPGELLSSLGNLLYIGNSQILAFGSISGGPDVVWRSNDAGASYSQVAIIDQYIIGHPICLAPGVAGFYAWRANSSTGYSRFYRTLDAGVTWTAFDIPITVLTKTGNAAFARIAVISAGATYETTKLAISIRLDNVNVGGVNDQHSRIIISDDGGETWRLDASAPARVVGVDVGPLRVAAHKIP